MNSLFVSYLLIAIKNLRQQPSFSAIKILSLSIGLSCSILVLMHVQFATQYDTHFAQSDKIYRLGVTFSFDGNVSEFAMTPDVYGPQLALDYPQIEHIVKVRQDAGLFSRDEVVSRNDYHWVEAGVIDLFSLQLISGDATSALGQPGVVVLSESAAEKYFPGEDALGQTLTLNTDIDLRVSAIMADLPDNSLQLQMLVSVETGRQYFDEEFMGGNAWNRISGTLTFLRFASDNDAQVVNADLDNFINRNLPEELKQRQGGNVVLVLEPLADIYLSARQNFSNNNNRIQVLSALSIFALLILLTSCINFANLSLSQVQQRSKEIGVRKALGAQRGQIIMQFITESVLLTVLALLIALPMIYLAIPIYTNVTNTSFTLGSVIQASSVLGLLAFVLLTGFLSGLFPALALSRLQTVRIIQGAIRGRINRLVRALVTSLQFTLSSVLMILAIAIGLQIAHLNTMDIGFNRADLIYLASRYNPDQPESFDYEAMVNELEQLPGVVSIAKSSCPLASVCAVSSWSLPGAADEDRVSAGYYEVDSNYHNTMQLNLLAGRWFSPDFPGDFLQAGEFSPLDENDSTRGIVITREAVGNFGFASPTAALDQILLNGESNYRVLGVVENFRMNGGMEDTERSVQILRSTLNPMQFLVMRIEPDEMTATVARIETLWQRHRVDTPMELGFFEQQFNDNIVQQTKGMSTSASFASIVTVLVSIFGLYGLAYYSTQRRVKEIGVRKVLGAHSYSIVCLLIWDFIKPVWLGCVFACGVGYVVVAQFFEQFSSQVEVSLWVYLIVMIVTLVMAIITVASQCIKAANSDPVQSLRYE